MTTYPVFADEAERLEALRALELLDTPQEERFDRITRTAQRVLVAPIALISLVDSDRQWFKSCQGLGISETTRSASFCTHALGADDLFVVPDAHVDPRFVDNPLVTGPPYIRFYAGKPLHSPTGHRVGTLCVLDQIPRDVDDDDRGALDDLAAWAQLELNIVTVSQAVQERDRLRRRLTAVLQSVQQGIGLIDEQQRVVAANEALVAMTHTDADELENRRLPDLFLDEHGEPLPALPPSGELSGTLLRPGGAPLDVEVTTTPLRNDIAGATVVVVTDVSRDRAVERLKDSIIGITAHELRTPLTAIRGALGLLQAGVGTAATDDATQRLLDNATRNTDRLIRLVNAMLDVERLAAGRMPMTFEPVDLLHVARGAAESLAAVADARGVTIDVSGEPVTVDADVDRMTQVALNLVDNALKFAPAGTAVRVSVHTSGDAAELAVADDGPGMAAEQAAVVFDRFVQLSHGGGTPAGGSGLGLAIVRGIVEQHDGAVRVDAAPGAGATFVVTLPLRQER